MITLKATTSSKANPPDGGLKNHIIFMETTRHISTFKKTTYILGGLIGLFILYLWFGGIFHSDIYSDNAINSFRALGWFDRLLGGQSTPIDWFGYVPGWATLSFHDAPPAVFFIQRVFFSFIGPSVFAARLPFVLAGLASAFFIFYFIRKICNQKIAIFSALIFLINSYAVWAALVGYLEGIQQMFIILAFFFLFLFLQNDYKTKYLYLWSGFLALSLISKYTSIFLFLPSLFFFILERKQVVKAIKLKKAIFAIIIFFAIASPVIIYNLNVYKTRGHFDAALSSMIGMHPDDFSSLAARKADFNLLGNFKSTLSTMRANNSYPFAAAILLSFVWLAVKIARRKSAKFGSYLIVNIASFFLLFSFFSPAVRFVSIITPLASIALGLALYDLYNLIKKSKLKNFLAPVFIFLAASVLIFETFYAYNTNVFHKPIGSENLAYSGYKQKNYGFNQLEIYMREKIIIQLPNKQIPRSLADLNFKNEDFIGRNVIIFDDRINWFAQYWYFQKYLNYYRWPVMSTTYLSPNGPALKIKDILGASEKNIYYIFPVSEDVLDETRKNDKNIAPFAMDFANKLNLLKVPYDSIANLDGKEAFRIYKITPEYSL